MNVAGKMNPIWYAYYEQLTRYANTSLNAINNFAVIASFVFKFPEDETVTVMMDCNFDWTITDIIVQTEQGTASVQLVVDGNNVDSPVLAGTVRLVTAIDGGDVANGNDIALTLASVSATCENLSVSIRGVRSFA